MSEQEQPNNPLHGVTLKAMVEALVETHGWEALADRWRWRCFHHNPTVKSVLTFVRKTDWARVKIERLYLNDVAKVARNKKRNARRAAQRKYRAEQEAAAAAAEDGGGGDGASEQTPAAVPTDTSTVPVGGETVGDPMGGGAMGGDAMGGAVDTSSTDGDIDKPL